MRDVFPIGFGLLCLAGCGAVATPVTSVEFCQEFADRVCAGVSPACLLPSTVCSANQVSLCHANVQAQTVDGRTFVPAKAGACLNKASETYGKLDQGTVALSAADLLALDSTCAAVFEGARQANEVCGVDVGAACTASLVCDKGHCGTPSLVAPGLGCANIGEYCSQGYYCGDSNGVLACIVKGGPNAVCDATPCLESLRCASGQCVAQLDFGEVCTSNSDCASGFCEPYAGKCASDVRFANGSAACLAFSSVGMTSGS